MIVAVTGAAGHLGANLVRALLQRGHTVRVLLRARRGASLEGLSLLEHRGDVLEPSTLDPLLDGAEVCFHLAARIALTPADDAAVLHVNTVGPRNVAAACQRARVRRLVHFSSVHALSPHPLDQVVTEDNAWNEAADLPTYDRSKTAGEKELLAAVQRGLDAVIVNPTGVLGPHDFVPRLANRMLLEVHHRTLPSTVEGGFNWVDARDVAEGAIAAAERGRRGERYLLGGRWVSVSDIARRVSELTGSRPIAFECPQWLARGVAPLVEGAARITGAPPIFTRQSLRALREHRHVSHDKAAAELGYAPRPLEDTIRDTLDFFGGLGYLEPGWRPRDLKGKAGQGARAP